jgi:hypothetical protein
VDTKPEIKYRAKIIILVAAEGYTVPPEMRERER